MVGSGYLGMLLVGIMAGCRKWECSLAIRSFDLSSNSIPEEIRQLQNATPLRGAIIPEPMCDRTDIIETLLDVGLPTVRIAPHREVGRTYDICIDHARAAYELTNYLIELGHRRIAFNKGPTDHGDANARFSGFVHSMTEHGMPIISDLCIQAETFDYSSGIPAGYQLVDAEQLPTAIFACNDELAAAVLEILRGRGIKVPDDISVIGFDDAPVARTVHPPLTTCRQKMELTGYTAVDFIITSPTSADARRRSQPHELVIRQTTGPAR